MNPGLNINPHKAFLVLGLIFGILFLFITPPFQAPDEESHFYKVYYLSEGNVLPEEEDITTGYFFPRSLEKITQEFSYIRFNPQNKQKVGQLVSLFSLPLDPNEKVPIKISNIAIYPPMSYLAAASIFYVFKYFNTSPLFLMYLGRMVNLFIWLFLVFTAIRITPVHKWIFFILALMPMALFLAPTLSADSFNIGLSFLVIALFFKLSFDENKEKIVPKDIFLLLIMMTILSLAKQGYAILLLLFLMIPKEKFNVSYLKNAYFALIAAVILLINSFWNFLFRDLYIPSPDPSVSASAQISYLLSNPLYFPYIFQKTLITNFYAYLVMFVGDLGWLDTYLPPVMVYTYLLVLIFYSLIDKTEYNITRKQKIIAFITFSVIFVVIFAFEYITWTPVGESLIGGVQSRYFIPMAPLIFILFYNRIKKIKIKNKEIPFKSNGMVNLALILFIIIFLSITVITLISRYYLP
jgi:uncharacterized membrane protein